MSERCAAEGDGTAMTGLGEDLTVRDETVAEAGEEAEAVKTLPTPVLPSKSERYAHRVTH